METQEKQFDEKDALKVVSEMINIAQGNIYDSYFYFILWGWISVFSSMITYALVFAKMGNYVSWIWPILGIAGGLASMIYGKSQDQKKKVKTIIDKNIGYTWGAFGISYFIVIFLLVNARQFQLIAPALFIVAGTATFLTGGLIRFRPLMIGGMCLYAFSIILFVIPSSMQDLISAVGIIVGYLIPGYMLKSKYKKNEAL